MELFILISCVLLLVLNIILIGLHVRSRKNNTAQDEIPPPYAAGTGTNPVITGKTTRTAPARTGKNSPLPSTISGQNTGKP